MCAQNLEYSSKANINSRALLRERVEHKHGRASVLSARDGGRLCAHGSARLYIAVVAFFISLLRAIDASQGKVYAEPGARGEAG